jgi:ABC-2 type transport system ATP-binding protein
MDAIEAVKLRMEFGSLAAVDDVSFKVERGESLAVLGPNGAGKSTLIRLLTTLLLPSGGSARVAGHDVVKEPDAVRRAIGVVPQAITSDPKLSAVENLEFSARLHGIPRAERAPLVEELIEAVDLQPWRDKLVGTFSGGMRRRVEIARCLIHQPEILFLDEPTTGLDPASRLAMWETLRQMRARRPITLLLTTHYMEEAEDACDHVAIVDHGKLVVHGTPDELKGMLPEAERIEVRFDKTPDDWATVLEGLPGVASVERDNATWSIRCADRSKALTGMLEATLQQEMKIESIRVTEKTLQDVFIHFTGRDVRDETTKLRLDSRLLHHG